MNHNGWLKQWLPIGGILLVLFGAYHLSRTGPAPTSEAAPPSGSAHALASSPPVSSTNRQGLSFPPRLKDPSFYLGNLEYNPQRRSLTTQEMQHLTAFIDERRQHLDARRDQVSAIAQGWTEDLLSQGIYHPVSSSERVMSEKGTIVSVADYGNGISKVVRIHEGDCAHLDLALADLWTEYEEARQQISDQIKGELISDSVGSK